MSILGWLCLALIIAYWAWVLITGHKIVDWTLPLVVTLILGVVVAFSAAAPPPLTGGSNMGKLLKGMGLY